MGPRSGATLIILGGLPGVGKTTVAREVADRLGAAHLRIDTIEQTLRRVAAIEDMRAIGYEVAYAVAADNLRAGRVVVADSVNPIELTRSAWRRVAVDAGAQGVEVELVCSDVDEHRRRVENRSTDVEGLKLPTWAAVQAREYEPWNADLCLDTSTHSAVEAAVRIVAALKPGSC